MAVAILCFNALNGLLSFLPVFQINLEKYGIEFQRPKRTSVISTKYRRIYRFIRADHCFNALNGLLSFLQMLKIAIKQTPTLFQRPKRASVISTLETQKPENAIDEVFQRPKRASVISTTDSIAGWEVAGSCFNALNGLLSFLRSLLPPRGCT